METIGMILEGHRPEVPVRDRQPILIDPAVRSRLRALLFEPQFRGVGYSAFIERACEVAETAIAQQRTERPQRRKDHCEVCENDPAGQRWLCPNVTNHEPVDG